ncbi:MAG: accessory gene regulator B family protein [Desulfotomaculales bacterium]
MLLDLPERVADYLRDRLGLGREEEEKVLYALQVFYYTGLAFAGAALAGWLLGCPAETVVVGLALFLLRSFSGGAHCRTPLGCVFAPLFWCRSPAGSFLLPGARWKRVPFSFLL